MEAYVELRLAWLPSPLARLPAATASHAKYTTESSPSKSGMRCSQNANACCSATVPDAPSSVRSTGRPWRVPGPMIQM